jgi:hypothetical protein
MQHIPNLATAVFAAVPEKDHIADEFARRGEFDTQSEFLALVGEPGASPCGAARSTWPGSTVCPTRSGRHIAESRNPFSQNRSTCSE